MTFEVTRSLLLRVAWVLLLVVALGVPPRSARRAEAARGGGMVHDIARAGHRTLGAPRPTTTTLLAAAPTFRPAPAP